MHNLHTLTRAVEFTVIFLLCIVAVSVILYRIFESIEESERGQETVPDSLVSTPTTPECESASKNLPPEELSS